MNMKRMGQNDRLQQTLTNRQIKTGPTYNSLLPIHRLLFEGTTWLSRFEAQLRPYTRSRRPRVIPKSANEGMYSWHVIPSSVFEPKNQLKPYPSPTTTFSFVRLIQHQPANTERLPAQKRPLEAPPWCLHRAQVYVICDFILFLYAVPALGFFLQCCGSRLFKAPLGNGAESFSPVSPFKLQLFHLFDFETIEKGQHDLISLSL